MKKDQKLNSNVFWLHGAKASRYPALSQDISIDVAIVGAGMVGLHSARSLADSGLRIAVFEARNIGEQATGRSTAKVTSQHGLCYATLARDFDQAHARLYAQHNEKALRLIDNLCKQIGPGAGFEKRDAYIYATHERQVAELEEETQAARAAGIDAVLERKARSPVDALAWLKFPQQAQFDPFGYLQGLARLLPENVQIYEDSRVDNIDQGRTCQLEVNGHNVKADHVIVATQIPTVKEGHFFTKVYPIAHAVAAAPLPAGVVVDGMFVSAGSPSHSFRTASRDGQTFLVAVGSEYKLGEPNEQQQTIEDLRSFLRDHFGIQEPSHLWTNEDFKPMDGAAFIGKANKSSPNLLVATGFAGWGITQGALAGDILADEILGLEHPAASLYDATRMKPVAGGAEFLKENSKAGWHMVGDRLFKRKAVKLDDIPAGEGGVVSSPKGYLAVRRDISDKTVALSGLCTHMGCLVDWNSADRTWDCPCHGSRFDESGAVLVGPATKPLEPRELSDAGDAEK